MAGSHSRSTALLEHEFFEAHTSELKSIVATSEINWFDGRGSRHASTTALPSVTALQERPVAVGAPQHVTTQDVLDVLGPDADDLLAATQLNVEALVQRLNAETMLLPRIDPAFEAEIEEALAGVTAEDEPPSAAEVATAVAASPKWRKRFLRAAIGTVLMAAAGGATAMAMSKSVTVDIDGQEHTVHTFGGTVGEVLEHEGVKPGAHDALSPSPNAPVTDGGKITLDRGRLLRMQIDGVERDHWTRATTVAGALKQLNITPAPGAVLSAPLDSQIPLNGMSLAIKTLKHITLVDGANTPRTLTTNAVSIGELLRSQHLTLGQNDSVSPSPVDLLTDGAQVLLSRTGISVINQQQEIAPPIQQIKDSTLEQGQQQIVDPGRPGQQVITFRIVNINGAENKREQLGVKILIQPKPQIVKVGIKVPIIANEAMWDRIAMCESHQNWSINTGNGYYGGLQFDRGTWLSNGGGKYAPTADKATRAQQIEIANRVKDRRGLQPWQCRWAAFR